VSKKNSQNCSLHNFVKFPPSLIIFGAKMAKAMLCYYVRCTHLPPYLIYVNTLPC